MWAVVVAVTLFLPLLVSVAGSDVFRLPKQLALIATSIVIAAVIVCARLLSLPFGEAARWAPAVSAVTVAALLWCGVTTALSTNRMLSINSLLVAAAAAVAFVASYITAQRRSFAIVSLAIGPAVINALVGIGQRTRWWKVLPFDPPVSGRAATIGLLGNANDVGMFVVAPALAAAVVAIVFPKHRLPAVIALIVLAGGLAATETVGAVAALAAGLFALILPIRPRALIIGALAALLAGSAFIRLSPTRWEMTKIKFADAMQGDVDRLLSGRLPAFLASWRMFYRNPMFGVGPGCFPFHYFDEKIAVEINHPRLMDRHDVNFGEVHNEHLQFLAEGGLPAYAIFIAAIVALARVSLRPPSADGDLRAVFARHLALPLAIALAVLSLSAFPFRLAAPTQNILFVCALTLAWSERAPD